MRIADLVRFAAPDASLGQPFYDTSSGQVTGMGAQTPPPAYGASISGRRAGDTPHSVTPADQAALLLAPGTVLAGRYEVRDRLGAGGMGVVYKVHDRMRGDDVALKAILPPLVQSAEALARFKSEAKMMLGIAPCRRRGRQAS